MAIKRLDYKQMTTAYVGASICSVAAGTVSAALWDKLSGQADYGLWIGGAWLVVVGVPSMVVASDTLLQILGKRAGISVRQNSGQYQGRKVPINYGQGRQGHLFLSTMPLIGKRGADELEPALPIELPQSFTVTIESIPYTIPVSDLRDFVHKAWARQRVGKPGFSRNYWTKTHKPKLDKTQYAATMAILSQIEGIVINRTQGRSGRLAVPPEACIKMLQGVIQ